MYETYLQNEREFEEFEKFFESKRGKTVEFVAPERMTLWVKNKNRLSRIKEMKALEKELEEERKTKLQYTDENQAICDDGYRKGILFSLNKIREFIKQLEQ